MDYYRKIKIDDVVVVSKSWDIETRMIKKKLPKHLKRKQLFVNSRGEYYYNEKVVVAKVKVLGAYFDRACTKRKVIK